ncbi:CSC1-like protein At1g69450 [Arachis ipaensis]|uniref:CSC1-like protein At1g69450 n=1 Tax=Arachis ipaensis TaxID=130454 RepID=UPI000A2B4EBB|nr:CSC1-like protein At1g69450 [Arachis ipaensis]
MIVSALLTSLGINTALCVLFFILYSILRKQPRNYEVYVPRLLAKGTSRRRTHFNMERLIPSPGWVGKAWRLSEEELLSLSGLDGVVFMCIITFSLKIFTFAGIIGILVILPVNCWGSNQQDFDITNFANNSLDVFTISNVNSGSNWLWVHFSAIYLVTGFICLLLFYEYRYISSRRISFFYSSKPQPHQFTILARSTPTYPGCSISDSVENFFKDLYPSIYLSHVVVHRTSKIRTLLNESKQLYKRITRLQSDSDPTLPQHNCCGIFGLCGRKSNLRERYEKKLEDIEENVRLKQSEVLLAGEEARAAFVFFKTRFGAATASSLQQSINPTLWNTELAPEPHDVYWPFFSESFMQRWISKLVVVAASILFTILFLIPVVFVQGLTNLSQLEVLFPFLTTILTIKFVSQVITGYLPSLILQLFLKLVPPVMEFLSAIQGHISHSSIELSATKKVLWFTIWNVFFATVFSGSVLSMLSILLDPKGIPSKLAAAVPAQASFFIAYVVTTGWTSVSSELFRIIPLIFSLIRRPFTSPSDEFEEVPSIPYHRDVPRILFFGLLGIIYFFLAPLILPFLLAYLCLAYIVFRNQFMNVYAPKYETAGKCWPIVHNSMIFSMVLMHIIAVGIFALKRLPLASTLVVPLSWVCVIFMAILLSENSITESMWMLTNLTCPMIHTISYKALAMAWHSDFVEQRCVKESIIHISRLHYKRDKIRLLDKEIGCTRGTCRSRVSTYLLYNVNEIRFLSKLKSLILTSLNANGTKEVRRVRYMLFAPMESRVFRFRVFWLDDDVHVRLMFDVHGKIIAQQVMELFAKVGDVGGDSSRHSNFVQDDPPLAPPPLHCANPNIRLLHVAFNPLVMIAICVHVKQSLIKRDREDENDATMSVFYDGLVNAYKDPALLPTQYSSNSGDLRSALISEA